MKTQTKLYKPILIVAVVTALILMVPLVAMQFTNEVDWNLPDFIIMGALIFGTGLSFVLISRSSPNIAYKAGVGAGLGSSFLMVWVNLAVGLIGSGGHAGNMMYIGVLAVGFIGVILSHFKPAGMERAMYAMSLALVFLAGIALVANMDKYPGSSVGEIIGVNAFFAGLFAVSGLFFRFAAQQQSPAS
jgi:hypothetical protein